MNNCKSVHKIALLLGCFIILSTVKQAHAQLNGGVAPLVAQPTGPPAKPTITGQTSVIQPAGTSTYTASTSNTSGTSYTWSLSNPAAGTISGTTTIGTLHWNSTFGGSVSVFVTASNSYGSTPSNAYVVTSTSPFVQGTISSKTTSINSGTSAILTGTAATGGNGNYTYQWQSSGTSNGTFTNINGATSLNYTNPNLTVTTYYRRMDASTNGSAANTNVVGIIVSPALVVGAVTPTSQGGLFGGPLTTISSTAATGGNGTYAYQWQSAPDNATWTNIVSNANGLTYVPANTTGTVYYRLAVTSNGQTLYSGSSAVLVSDCNALGTTPTASQNYIMTTTFSQSGVASGVTDAQIAAMGVCQANQTIQYLDGLGRSIQTVQVKASPAGYDIIQPQAYDVYGREATKYLPYTLGSASTGNGSYQSTAINDQATFYNPPGSTGTQQGNGIVITNSPFAVTGFEVSPLNRVIEQGAPGDAWQLSTSGVTGSGHTVKTVYSTNASEVTLWTVNSAGNGATGTTAYPAGSLYKTITTDEMGNNTFEYKNLQGQVVCKMVQNGTATLATYYVYDIYNNLAYVIPPIPSTSNPTQTAYPASFLETDAVFLNYMYGYHYDSRNRQIQKKIPGKGWQYMVYNQLDQLVLSQDAVQGGNNQWVVTKYDANEREVVTGLWNAGSLIAQSTLQSSIYAGAQYDVRDATNNTTANPTGYVISSYPALSKTLTIDYYDDYTFTGQPSAFTAPTGAITAVKGLPTATITSVLNTINNTTPDMLWKVNYYDNLGRTIQTYAQHYLGGSLSLYNYDVITNTYNFANEVTGTTRQQYIKNSANTVKVLAVTIANTYAYDQVGREKQTFEQINNGTNVLLVDDEYNEIGQLMTKNLHSTNYGSSYLQNTSYAYNERGWLSKINDPTVPLSATKLFAEQLNYNVPAYGATAQYNGNVAEDVYETYNNVNGVGTTTAYHTTYAYDALNRLTAGVSSTGNSESPVSYDVLGNISTLTRSGVDAATLSYKYTDANNNSTGNLLQSVTGLTTPKTYTYDGNGNVKSDGTNTFTYNTLNLPQTVSSAAYNITYTYDADGTKLRKVSTQTSNGVVTTTDYISGIQYKTNSTVIDFIQTEEGRVNNAGSSWNYEYTLTDHLGNNRTTFDMLNGKTNENDYYPFGYYVPKVVNGTNYYLYNKKELQPEITEYDYGARFYDPIIARWEVPDPMAENHYDFTAYNYVLNNPISYLDIMGLDTLNANKVTPAAWHNFNTQQDVMQLNEVKIRLNSSNSDNSDQQANQIDIVITRLKAIPRQRYQYGGTGKGNYSNYLKAISNGIDCSCYISTGFGEKGRVWTTSAPPPTTWGLKKVNIGNTKEEILKNLKKGDVLVWNNHSIKHTGMIDVENGEKVLLNSHGNPKSPNSGPGASDDLETYYFDERHTEIPIPTVYRKQ